MLSFKQFLIEDNGDSSEPILQRAGRMQKFIKRGIKQIDQLRKHPKLSETHFNTLELHHKDLKNLDKEVDYLESHGDADELDVSMSKILDNIEKISNTLE